MEKPQLQSEINKKETIPISKSPLEGNQESVVDVTKKLLGDIEKKNQEFTKEDKNKNEINEGIGLLENDLNEVEKSMGFIDKLKDINEKAIKLIKETMQKIISLGKGSSETLKKVNLVAATVATFGGFTATQAQEIEKINKPRQITESNEDKTLYGPDFPVDPKTEDTFFSAEELNKQRKWLIDWLKNRKLTDPENQKEMGKFLDARITTLKNTNVEIEPDFSSPLPDSAVGGVRPGINSIFLREDYKNSIDSKRTPLHEFSHIADVTDTDKGNFGTTLPFEQKLINENIISYDDLKLICKDLTKKFYDDLVGNPTEAHSRIVQLRYLMNFKPDQIITDKEVKAVYKKEKKGELSIGEQLILYMVKDKNALKNLLNGLVMGDSKQDVIKKESKTLPA